MSDVSTTTRYRLVAPDRSVVVPELDEHQQRVVDHEGGPLLVLAGPGTGKTTTLVEAIVERYAEHPALELWHVNNEYGCHVSRCYCDASAAAFRVWLEQKYGTIDALNDAWGTAFWSQHYAGFDEILPPRAAPSCRSTPAASRARAGTRSTCT